MLIKRAPDIPSSEITPHKVYLNRRTFMEAAMQAAATTAAGVVASRMIGGESLEAQGILGAVHGTKIENVQKSKFSTDEAQNSWKEITTYNNFLEFGQQKDDAARYAPRFLKPSPWTVSVEGECAKPGMMNVEDILKGRTLEERVYRLRCVEAWSMVVPWIGFPLADFIKQVQPTSKAKFVEFTTLKDGRQMPGVSSSVLEWPYLDALRMDEAMHPLTILAVGLYGEVLPHANGAPIRLVVPWKYGFKSVKSIVRIRFVEQQPVTVWMKAAADEYGFYANVNPAVDHPRWTQATERRLPEFFKRKTLPFNGYADQVASLYTGMDLRVNF